MNSDKRKELSVVIPFFNDAGCPAAFVEALEEELKGIDYEMILVDDGSADSTPEELDSLAGERIVVLHNQENRDYGGAITRGMDAAQGEYLCFTCGDGEITPRQIAVISRKKACWDVVKACREYRKDGLGRIIMTKVFNSYCRIRFGIRLKDTNGYPVFMKREVYESVPRLRTDWLFNLDLYRKLLAQGHDVYEFPVVHGKRQCGKSHMTPKRIARMILGLLVYR